MIFPYPFHIINAMSVHSKREFLMQSFSRIQLAAAVFLFQLGSSPLFLLAGEARRDAWLSVLVGMLSGLLLLILVTLPIHRREPGKSLVEMLPAYLGKWLGGAVAAAYVLYFSYKSVRNVREFGDWMILYLLPETPLYFITLVLMLISAFAVYHGVEVFFRLAELLWPWIVLMYAILFGIIIFSNLFHPENLQPVMEHGLKPVLEAALPEVVSFPFGEMVLFLMFWKHSDRAPGTSRATLFSFASAGLFLVFANMTLLCVLGAMAGTSVIPLLEVTSLLKFAERLDPLVLLMLFIGVYMKQTAYYLGASLALSQLTGMNRKLAILPVGALIYFGSLAFRSYMQQVRFGFKYNVNYHFPIFQIAIPLVLLTVMLIRSPKPSTTGE